MIFEKKKLVGKVGGKFATNLCHQLFQKKFLFVKKCFFLIFVFKFRDLPRVPFEESMAFTNGFVARKPKFSWSKTGSNSKQVSSPELAPGNTSFFLVGKGVQEPKMTAQTTDS